MRRLLLLLPRDSQQRQWLSLTSACLLMTTAGQALSGPVYADFLKLTVGLTQLQIEICMATILFGGLLSFVSSVVFERLGRLVTVVVSGCLSTVSCICLAVAFSVPGWPLNHFLLLNFALFLYGHSFNYSLLSAVATAMTGLSGSSNGGGSVMTLLDSCFGLGAPIVSLIYYVVFNRSHETDLSPVGTLVTLACGNAVVHAFAACWLTGKYEEEEEAEEVEEEEVVKETEATETTPIVREGGSMEFQSADQQSPSGKQTSTASLVSRLLQSAKELLTVRYLLCLSGFTLTQAPSLTLLLNLTTVSRVHGLSNRNLLLFWAPAASAVTWRLLIGPLTDTFLPKAKHRAVVMATAVALLGTVGCGLLSLPTPSSALANLLVAYCLIAASSATVFTILPVILASISESSALFCQMYAGCVQLKTLLVLPLALLFGLLISAGNYWQSNFANLICHSVGVLCLIVFAIVVWRSNR